MQIDFQPDIEEIADIQTYSFLTVEDGVQVENQIQLVSTTTVSLRTTLNVPDGGTALVGGFSTATEERVNTGLPIISNIPVLGRFFSRSDMLSERRVHLYLVTPHIVIADEYEARL